MALVKIKMGTLRNSTIKTSTKRIPRQKKTSLAKLMRQADQLAGQLCRQRSKCASCGRRSENTVFQWCHIISRTYKGLRWSEDNCLCLCAPCHARFTYRPSNWIAWLMENMPVKYLDLERRSREVHKPNRWEMERIIKELQTKIDA